MVLYKCICPIFRFATQPQRGDKAFFYFLTFDLVVSNRKYLFRRELMSLVLLVSLTRSKKKRGVGKRLAQTSLSLYFLFFFPFLQSLFPHPLTQTRIVVLLQCVT